MRRGPCSKERDGRGRSMYETPFVLPAMKIHDPTVLLEMPVIRKIVEDETWLEGERRGCHVPPTDRVVRDRVCEVVLSIGQQLRDSLTRSSG